MRTHRPSGFTLPAVLVVTAALLILAVGMLMVSGIERGTARSHADRLRADLAARAALEEVRGILDRETSNDDFIILQSTPAARVGVGRDPAPMLFLARGNAGGGSYFHRYVPLFSALSRPADTLRLVPPAVEPLTGGKETGRLDFTALPYQDKVRAAWLHLRDGQGRVVARYAYWVEDMQCGIDPRTAGNTKGPGGIHARAAYPFPAPGLNDQPSSAGQPALDQIALFAIDPAASGDQTLGKTLIKNRGLLVSPGSLLAAAGAVPPLARDAAGHLTDPRARAAEENLRTDLRPYLERPLLPFADGIHPSVAGKPGLNLNRLLATGREAAVNEMAEFIRQALPQFEDRKGGFPDDYPKTLAANALDYADADSDPSVGAGYRGLDACPLMSEIALQVNYEGIANEKDRKIMKFRFRVFAELFNPTNQEVSGKARLSYEVALPMDGVGSGTGGVDFDSPELLSNPGRSTHQLTRIDSRYWSPEVEVSLRPNEYRCHAFAEVFYRIDVGPASTWIPDGTPFSLDEPRGASGMSLMWNGKTVDRVERIVRQEGLVYSEVAKPDGSGGYEGGFRVGTRKTLTKAALPGHVYDNYWPDMHYNMGDPRITLYLRDAPAAENAYPENISPNRRNVRLNIYRNDAPEKPKVYARVLPSEWPDGGHNAAVGTWTPGTSDKTELTDPKFGFPYDPRMEYSAPQMISNRGRFFSATELGRVFDPIMHLPSFPGAAETKALMERGLIPAGGAWPDAAAGRPSPHHGGGNTLRIGRPEHAAFEAGGGRGRHAARLLDLFHAGIPGSETASEREGPLVEIAGRINLNTATRDSLRALAAGALAMDPSLAERSQNEHDASMMPPVVPLSLGASKSAVEADRVADAIIRSRPFASSAEIAFAREPDGTGVFGDRRLYPEGGRIEWTDAACEEVFARIYQAATVRSRNFRVWIVAQALAPAAPGAKPEVLAEVRKSYSLFADPGKRRSNGSIDSGNAKTTIISSNEF